MISIDTKRLHLRNVLQNDVDVIFDYRNNEICARYQRGQVKDYDGIVSLIERRRNDEISIDFPCMIAVALKDTNEMIGEIVVMPKDHTFSLGYTFSYKYHRHTRPTNNLHLSLLREPHISTGRSRFPR